MDHNKTKNFTTLVARRIIITPRTESSVLSNVSEWKSFLSKPENLSPDILDVHIARGYGNKAETANLRTSVEIYGQAKMHTETHNIVEGLPAPPF